MKIEVRGETNDILKSNSISILKDLGYELKPDSQFQTHGKYNNYTGLYNANPLDPNNEKERISASLKQSAVLPKQDVISEKTHTRPISMGKESIKRGKGRFTGEENIIYRKWERTMKKLNNLKPLRAQKLIP